MQGFREEADEIKALDELAKHEAARQKLIAKIDVLGTDIRQLSDQEKVLSKAPELQKEKQSALDAAETALAQIDKRIQDSNESRSKRMHRIDAQINQLDKQHKDIEAKKNRIAGAGEEGECPTCERPLAGELPKVLANFDQQLADIARDRKTLSDSKSAAAAVDVELEKLIRSSETLKVQIKTLSSEKSKTDADVTEYQRIGCEIKKKKQELDSLKVQLDKLPQGYDEKRHTELKELKESLQPVRDRFNALKGELQRQKEAERQLAEQQDHLKTKSDEVSSDQQALDALGFAKQDHEEIIKKYNDASSQRSDAALEVQKQQGSVNTQNAILTHIKDEESSYNTKVTLLKNKQSERLHLKTLCDAFDQFRTELNDRIRPELESIASEFLAEMTDGRYNTLEIDDQYKATIRDDGEPKSVISGGEGDVVNLALRLAISQMIADRAGQSFSLLVFDEVFGSLDATRRDNVVSLMQNLKNRFEQIIVITHIEAIHDATDSCLWVEFNEQTKTSQLVDRSVTAL